MSSILFVTDPNQIDSIKSHNQFEFICKKCDKKIIVKNFNPAYRKSYKTMTCRWCKNSYTQKHFTPEQKAAKLEKIRQYKLKKYGDPNYNNRDKAKTTCLEKYGSENPLGNKEIYSKAQDTREKKYGVRNYVQTEKFKEQKKDTQILKYGDPTYTNRKKADKTFRKNHNGMSLQDYNKTNECRNKTSKTLSDKYGENVKNVGDLLNLDNFKEKSKQTKLEKYGDPYYTNHEKCKLTKLEKYNDPYYSNSEKAAKTFSKHFGKNITSIADIGSFPEIQIKKKNTCLKFYNSENYMSSEDFKEKTKQTKIKLYGDPNYKNKEKAIETKLKKYGRSGGFCHKYNYYGIFFDSSWELAVWIYCIDHNIPIIRSSCQFEYVFNGEKRHYIPDFWIEGIGLVEIKGDQFLDATTGKWVCPYDRSQDELFEAKHLCGLQNGIIFWNENEIRPFLDYINRAYCNTSLYEMFKIDNPLNPSYFNLNGYYPIKPPYYSIPIYYSQPIVPNKGISPYDIDKDNEYTICKDSKGIYPIGGLIL